MLLLGDIDQMLVEAFMTNGLGYLAVSNLIVLLRVNHGARFEEIQKHLKHRDFLAPYRLETRSGEFIIMVHNNHDARLAFDRLVKSSVPADGIEPIVMVSVLTDLPHLVDETRLELQSFGVDGDETLAVEYTQMSYQQLRGSQEWVYHPQTSALVLAVALGLKAVSDTEFELAEESF